MNHFILHISKLGKPESPERSSYPCNHAIRLNQSGFRCWRCSLPSASHYRPAQVRNECTLAVQTPEEDLSVAKPNVYSHPTVVAECSGPLSKQSSAILAILDSFLSIMLLILFENHVRSPRVLLPNLSLSPLS